MSYILAVTPPVVPWVMQWLHCGAHLDLSSINIQNILQNCFISLGFFCKWVVWMSFSSSKACCGSVL